MYESKLRSQMCMCIRAQMHRRQRLKKEQSKRKRQMFVFNPEEDTYHEPYMRNLRKEFSVASVVCDSKVELPWKDIALPAAGMKIRHISSNSTNEYETPEAVEELNEGKPAKKESTGSMPLPWHDLVISEVVKPREADPATCGSTLEIPWSDLTLEKPVEIRAPVEEETCNTDDVEIPWDDILIPRNVVIEPQKKKQHPSSKRPPQRKRHVGQCSKDCGCCAKVGSRSRPAMFCT